MLTTADLLLSNQQVEDADQQILLYELCRFLTHDSAGVKGFDRMPKEWGELNKLVSAGGKIPKKSDDAEIVLRAWHQETKDLSLILSRQTETTVSEKLSRAHMNSAAGRLKDELAILIDTNCLSISLNVPDAAAPIQILADMGRRTVEVGMTIRAPEDKKSSKARLNWLLRQLKSEETDDIFIRLNWPGRSESTQFALSELRDDPSICEEDKGSLQVLSFHLFTAKRLGAKFTQQMNFISELEALVPLFYREFGQDLVEWRKAAPKIEKIAKPVSDIDLEDIQEIIEK